MLALLIESEDPFAQVMKWERPWNCELPGSGRIRLDNVPSDRTFDLEWLHPNDNSEIDPT